MSMITEQIKELRSLADNMEKSGQEISAKYVRNAAETIEVLSNKLAAENTERSRKYYNSEWIPCSERLPESLSLVLVQVNGGNIHTMHYLPGYNCFRSENGVMHHLEEISGWLPFPESYKEEYDV